MSTHDSSPIRIGYCLSLTGALGGNGQSARLAHDIWREDVCDLLFLCSYLSDSIALVRALRAHAFRPKMVGGAMIGPQNTSVKTALGPLLNGIVNYEYWAPVPSMTTPGVQAMLETYRTRAAAMDVDLLGHDMAPLAYAQMQVVAQAVEATGSLDDAALIAYARRATFKTVMGTSRSAPTASGANRACSRCNSTASTGTTRSSSRTARDRSSSHPATWPPDR